MKILFKILARKEENKKSIRADNINGKFNATDYVNSNKFSSATNNFIWVDLKNFKVNIFEGSVNEWRLVHSYLCTIGKKSTPTPRGTLNIGIKGLYFGVNKGYKCWYYTQFKGNYLFHSII